MQTVIFDPPTIRLRCGQCTATANVVEIVGRKMQAAIACMCEVPAFELVFHNDVYRDPLVILPLELRAPKVGAGG